MVDMNLSGYIKSFRIAYNNVRQCMSTWSEKRVVELFIRNLNQSNTAFVNFSRRILDSTDSLYALVSQPLESAISYVETYHKTVIVPDIANAQKRTSISAIKSLKELKAKVDSSAGDNQGSFSVPYTILAAILNNTSKTNNNSKSTKKRGAVSEAEVKQIKKKICYNFTKDGSCAYGDNCHFSHTKS